MSNKKIWDFWAGKYEKLWVQKYSLSPTRRDIINELKEVLKPGASYNILDMGCGTGQLIRDMQSELKGYNIRYTGVDLSDKMIELAKEQDSESTYLNYSIDEFMGTGDGYDIIVCSHSFPYYPDQKGSITKFHNLLKPDGLLFLAQASANTFYDHLAMFFVKFTTGSASYLSVTQIKKMVTGRFEILKIHLIKEKSYMPTICLYILKKAGK